MWVCEKPAALKRMVFGNEHFNPPISVYVEHQYTDRPLPSAATLRE